MNKVISILEDFGWAVLMLVLIIVAAGILVLLAVPAGTVFLINEAVTTIKRKYEERKRSDSEDMCEQKGAEDNASDGDAARDTTGAEHSGHKDEF